MSDDLITRDELRAMFGDAMPMDAVRILFPEHFEGGVRSERPIAKIRSDLVACALRHRGAPMTLSKDNQAERLAMVQVLQSHGLRRPIDRAFLIELNDSLLGNSEALAVWLTMADEALDIMRDARVRMTERLNAN